MKRWIHANHDFGEAPDVDQFLAEISALCAKHGMWLSHEDGHGQFQIVSESTQDWLEGAADARGKP
ncbi:MAG: hypothetical protein RL375_2175 [Pseudomonadota bacterium]